ncbi:MAG: hypothetical protein AUH41_09500 [Gemmatimonadetes bacterium 13_1_40CM_66_11]|nr:MAG: hypothetical protein AUH41_09500 [Gemmatimonadetes bacterium 13_1_40CM_66_11]
MQDRVQIKAGRAGTNIGTAARASDGLVRPDDFPQDDRASQHSARLAQDFAFITAKGYSAQLSSIGIPDGRVSGGGEERMVEIAAPCSAVKRTLASGP